MGMAIEAVGATLPDNKCTGRPPVCDDKQIPERGAFFTLATAVGIGIDILHRDRTILYSPAGIAALRLVPILMPERNGLALALRFSYDAK